MPQGCHSPSFPAALWSLVPESCIQYVCSLQKYNQRTVLIQVFKGKHTKTSKNTLVVQFEFSGIPPAARGISQFNVVFKLDMDSTLHVEAKELLIGNSNHIVITSRRGRLSEQDLSQMTATSREYKAQDANQLASSRKTNEIQHFMSSPLQ
ncbi:70-kilodalton heat shock protein [Ceratobasidium sp. 428]|nr:70-kilodalton heat shock protein [Ceratobasidium sp. 428]